jgi:hypothetical protein
MSEFGQGYITCLFQYTNHHKRLGEYLVSFGPTKLPEWDSEQHAVEMWANGASDHLYGLRRPVRHVTQKEWDRAQAMAGQALDWGHGFRGTYADEMLARLNLAEAKTLARLCLDRFGHPWPDSVDQAVEIDQKILGIKRADKGEYACTEDLDRYL